MSRKVSIRKLAAELGLAPSTVHRALSGHPNVSLKTRREVLRISQKKGYMLPIHEKGNIAIIVPYFSFCPYLRSLLPYLESKFHDFGFRIMLILQQDVAMLNDLMVDGIVSLVWEEGLEKQLPRSFSIPIISINSPANTLENIPRIISDPKGIRNALEYLRNRGCRKIFFIISRTENVPDAAERLEEFRQFCAETGQDFDALHLEAYGTHVIKENLPVILKAKPDACFCASETYTVNFAHMLKEAGKRIPEDISLMGLEDERTTASFSPPITAIRQDFEQLAELAAREMYAACHDKIPPRGATVPFRLIERESVRQPGSRNKKHV